MAYFGTDGAGRKLQTITTVILLSATGIAAQAQSTSATSTKYSQPAEVHQIIEHTIWVAPPQVKPPFVPSVPTQVDTTSAPLPQEDTGFPSSAGLGPDLQLTETSEFPAMADLKGSTDFILIKCRKNATLRQLSPYAADVEAGDAMGSVRAPSRLGILKVPGGEVAIAAGGDAMVRVDPTSGITRIVCLNGGASRIRVKIDKGDGKNQAYVLDPGFELAFGKSKLTAANIRPHDGWARRRVQTFDHGEIALAEINTETVLITSPLIASMVSESGERERRVIKDLSRMAAVLNAVNGTTGYIARN